MSQAWSSPMWLAPWPHAHAALRPIDPQIELPGLVRPRQPDQGAAQVLVGGDVEEAGLGIEGGRRPVLASPQSRAERHRLSGLRLLLGVVGGPPRRGVDALEHLLVDEGLGVDEADAVSAALQQPEVAVPSRMHQALDRAAAPLHVEQHRGGDLIPVPGVVPVILVMAADLARVGVEGDHRGRNRGCRPGACRPARARRCRCPSTSG